MPSPRLRPRWTSTATRPRCAASTRPQAQRCRRLPGRSAAPGGDVSACRAEQQAERLAAVLAVLDIGEQVRHEAVVRHAVLVDVERPLPRALAGGTDPCGGRP